jgi:hypothetical protein
LSFVGSYVINVNFISIKEIYLHLFLFWIGRNRDRERQRERQRKRETERETEKERDRERDRQIDRERDKETVIDSKRDRQRDRQRNRQIEGDKGVNKYVTNNFVQPFLNFFQLRLWGKLD